MSSIVITTIQAPSASVAAMLAKARATGFNMIAIGDRKTPDVVWPQGVRYFNIQQQIDSGFDLARALPVDHYARKNIGYLIAMAQRATVIFDTDDDNAPLDSWQPRPLSASARSCAQSGWVNVYQWFSDVHIWPRGLPLEYARKNPSVPTLGPESDLLAPIQQGLVNGAPDVDAVWRQLMDQDIRFRAGESVHLPEGAWCPFNSQSTWWFPAAYSLMYLPSFVTFRMTDIWRSFVAQRCLWALGYGLVFHGPEMFQDRNPHNLLHDFEQEVPGYLSNDQIRGILQQTPMLPGMSEVGSNLRRCYEALIVAELIPAEEMELIDCWLADVARCNQAIAE